MNRKLSRILTGWISLPLLLLLAFGGGMTGTARAAVANFCWCGFFVAAPHNDSGKQLETQLSQVYRRHLKTYEDRHQGVIRKLLSRLEWDEMNYYGYVALPEDENGQYPAELENLDTTYGLFLALEQVLDFAPDVTLVNGQPVTTYTTYLFGSLNLFQLHSRRLISSRPFFITASGRRPRDPAAMLDLALARFARRLADPGNRFTRAMLKQWQEFFGPRGEQRDVVREAEGLLDKTYGVAPLCSRCIRIKGDQVDAATEKQLKTFIRYYFNARMAKYHPVVFLPAFRGRVLESIHTLVTATKEGDVAYTSECLAGYSDSGQTRLCIKFPPPRNLVKLSLRCLVEEDRPNESGMRLRTYNTILDLALFFPGREKPVIRSLTNLYRQLLAPHRKPSPLYYFNSLINTISGLEEATLEP
jgi:hypothetical protein